MNMIPHRFYDLTVAVKKLGSDYEDIYDLVAERCPELDVWTCDPSYHLDENDYQEQKLVNERNKIEFRLRQINEQLKTVVDEEGKP